MNRNLTCAMFVMALIFGGLQLVSAGTVWDAYTDYNTTGVQTPTDVWQYLYMPNSGGINGPYAAMPVFVEMPYGGNIYDLWSVNDAFNMTYFGKITGVPDIRSDFGDLVTGTLAWQSPIDGNVDVSFQVRKQIDGGDGANYWVFESGNPTPLASGSIAGVGGTSGLITLPNLPVSQGTTIYLQTDPGANPAYNTLGVTFTVTAVPEPGTIVLLCSGLMGLVIYVRRNRK